MSRYISPDLKDLIIRSCSLEGTAQGLGIELSKQGSSHVGVCPNCGKKKFQITVSKGIFKCFTNGCPISGTNPIGMVMLVKDIDFPEACKWLMDLYGIIEDKPKKVRAQKESFRDIQLRASGITQEAQEYLLEQQNGEKIKIDRYEAGTWDSANKVVAGDDMIIHYLDLDGNPLTYYRGSTKHIFTRIRYANPEHHKDKDGNPVRYRSPYKSGSHLYIPNSIIDSFKEEKEIETLYLIEGEKKADKMCMHEMPAVAVGGIHNFSLSNEMPHQLQRLVTGCKIKRVVFLLDSDCFNISNKSNQDVQSRPYTFFKAVIKFRNYFYAFANQGIELSIHFGYGLDTVHKGMDDLLVYQFKGQEGKLRKDLEETIISVVGEGEFLNVHNITSESDYKIKEYWGLQDKDAFFKKYRGALIDRPEFIYRKIRHRFNQEEKKFEAVQKIMPYEQFWADESYENSSGREIKRTVFDYINIRNFLFNRGFGIYRVDGRQGFRFIQEERKVIAEVDPLDIQRFVIDFTETSVDNRDVLQMLLRGGDQYLGPKKLSQLKQRSVDFIEPEKEVQYLVFQNCYWRITAEEIIQRPLEELPKHVWAERVNEFDARLTEKPIVEIEREKDTWNIKRNKQFCDIERFYWNTSNFHWRKEWELVKGEDGIERYMTKDNAEPLTQDDIQIQNANYICKMIAAGYVLHEYRDYSNMKAVICMDGLESDIGKSMGGSGKSIFSTQFKHCIETFIVDGKKIEPGQSDKHIYDGVDERTNLVVINDVRVNFQFEQLFSDITEGIEVNPKGEKKFRLDPPKFIISTNHALNGNDTSHDRRQYMLSFSDYYNKHRTPYDTFGRQLFHEWDEKQWNLYYNFMAICIQANLKYGLKYTIPMGALERRKLRQAMGSEFLEWAELFYDESINHRNIAIEKNLLFDSCIDYDLKLKKYLSKTKFKEKLQLFCIYKSLEWNPNRADKEDRRHKSNGREYFTIGDENFDINKHTMISSEYDFKLHSDMNVKQSEEPAW